MEKGKYDTSGNEMQATGFILRVTGGSPGSGLCLTVVQCWLMSK